MSQDFRSIVTSRRFTPVFGVILIAQATSACVSGNNSENQAAQGDSNFVTGSINPSKSSLQQANSWAKKWQEDPSDPNVAIKYARSLRAIGSNKEAVGVLQQASLTAPKNQSVIAEFGKALTTTGQLKQAMHNLNRAQSLGQPDWRIYSAQGIVLDKMGQYVRAREYYTSALNLAPNNASVLNNIGLSYALEGKLAKSETFLRRAADAKGAKPKVKQNLALVLGLGGKFTQSAETSKKVLSPEDTATNIAYLKNMLSQPGTWQKLAGKIKLADAKPSKTKKSVPTNPKKITTLKRVEKPKVAAKKKITPKAGTQKQAAAKRPVPAKKKTSSFSNKIKKALASTQKTASVDPLNLRTGSR